jgi:3-hydroxypropanoate dehydrogenase
MTDELTGTDSDKDVETPMTMLTDEALDLVFRNARTHSAFTPEPVSDDLLHQIWDVAKMGPTSANSLPLRVVFVKSPAAKERLRPSLSPGNVDKTMQAPVTAIFAYDLEFYEKLPTLYPPADMRSLFKSKPAMAEAAAKTSAALQAAYFIVAARGFGLYCGPMGGFDSAKADAEFLAGTSWRSFLLCNLGHGDPTKLHPRNPRLGFDEVARVV